MGNLSKNLLNKLSIIALFSILFSFASCNKEDVFDDPNTPPTSKVTTGLEAGEDIQIFATSATATSEMVDKNPANSRLAEHVIDGSLASYHNSKTGAVTSWPFVYEITFDNPADRIDYINYVSRQDAGNGWGSFGKFDVYVSTVENPEYTKVNDEPYDAGLKMKSTYKITFNTPLKDVKSIKINVLTAKENRVSCAEVQFFKRSFDFRSIFTDGSYSEIKSGVTQADINMIDDPFFKAIADAIFNGTYQKEFRIQSYRPYQHPNIKADENWTGYYSERDNPTGIYVTEGEDLYAFVGDTKGRKLSLLVQELRIESSDPYGADKAVTYPIYEGMNRITMKIPGLVYVQYLVDESVALVPKTSAEKGQIQEMSVKINFAGGTVNGYFDSQKHTDADWRRILAFESGSRMIDVMGTHSHVTWMKEGYRAAKTNARDMTVLYDNVAYLEQQLMGLERYNDKGGLISKVGGNDRTFRNRIYLHVHPGNPAASNYRTHFPKSYDEIFTKPDRLKARVWGPAHEIGHVNQTRPGFNWGGIIETSNNIFCLYIQEKWNMPMKLQEENYYEKARKALKGTSLAYSAGATAPGADHYVKLVPMWQLYLYTKANGNTNFYPDLFELYRKAGLSIPGADPSGKNQTNRQHGVLQAEFARFACHAAKINLLDFFVDWGFLRESDITINEYIDRRILLTAEKIAEVKADIESMNYPKPNVDVTMIDDNNQNDFAGTIGEAETKFFNTSGWNISTSHNPYVESASIGGWKLMIDNNNNTCMALVKPGKSLAGITVPKTDAVYFVVDMGKQETFNTFNLRHRTNNSSAQLRLKNCTVLGSNDGNNFTPIKEDISIAYNVSDDTVLLGKTSKFRYMKVVFNGFDSGGSTIQISEFKIGMTSYSL